MGDKEYWAQEKPDDHFWMESPIVTLGDYQTELDRKERFPITSPGSAFSSKIRNRNPGVMEKRTMVMDWEAVISTLLNIQTSTLELNVKIVLVQPL